MRTQNLFRVIVIEQRALPVHSCSLQLLRDAGAKVDNDTPPGQVLAIVGIQDSASTGCQNDVADLRKLIDRVSLSCTKALLTFLFKNETDIDTRALLNFEIAIEELFVEFASKRTADSGLARAHRPDQKHAVHTPTRILQRLISQA